MEEMRDQFQKIRNSWESIYEEYATSPSLWEPYLPYSNPDTYNEVINICASWLDRVRSPKGLAPVYHLAKGALSTSLESTLSTLRQIEEGQHNQLPTLAVRLTQLINALHTMISISIKDTPEAFIADTGLRLEENISLTQTAQGELGKKVQQLEEASTIASSIREYEEELNETKASINTTVETVSEILVAAETEGNRVSGILEETQAEAIKLEELVESNEALQSKMTAQQGELDSLKIELEKQQGLVKDLLPDAASAGLAHSFSSRASKLSPQKWIWMIIFLINVGVLAFMVFEFMTLFSEPVSNSQDMDWWKLLLQKLPLAAPMVWLGWFSAVQYGNTIRIQEDYEFKAATSKAFVGYRDHMEYLANINLEDGNNAV
ncbi:MAG: hypothetical protein H8E26_10180 [FCB group bacterium]|nr:hypothetical protein [FCB group bacterium]MBL7029381.1 hypothetical protein [Candidatus Neomarinimicrobiota bacterium]MBL7123064.1 hypothetical protein [Candidatus Neomarinimicrobiota bacterium]